MTLTLPAGPFAAYLFDCDGTIVDSMPLHYVAWNRTLAEWNCEFPEDLFYAWGGMPVAEIIATLNRNNGLQMPVETIAKRKEAMYFDVLPQLHRLLADDPCRRRNDRAIAERELRLFDRRLSLCDLRRRGFSAYQ